MNKTMEFFLKINDLQNTKRYGKYPAYTESTSEHTFKVILIVDYLFRELKLDLNYGKCIKIAIYHDFSEIDLDIDIDAYESSKMESNAKKHMESKKISEISKKFYSDIEDIFREYEEKESEESKFVNACDKLEACIYVLSKNKEIMNYEFFATYSDNTILKFPKLLPIYKEVKTLMRKRYQELGYDWKSEYDKIFNKGEKL